MQNRVMRARRVRRDNRSALTRLVAGVLLVDDVNATLAANEPVVAVTGLQRLERVLDLHFIAYGGPSGLKQKRA
jgi:hypothetical protein